MLPCDCTSKTVIYVWKMFCYGIQPVKLKINLIILFFHLKKKQKFYCVLTFLFTINIITFVIVHVTYDVGVVLKTNICIVFFINHNNGWITLQKIPLCHSKCFLLYWETLISQLPF